MTRPLLAAAGLAWLAGCTLLFNPDNVKVSCEALPAPAPLDALAGDGTSLTFEWADARGDAGSLRDWQVCWGGSAGALDTCKSFDGGCAGGRCSLTVEGSDAGFVYNRRVFAKVVSRDRCGQQSAPATTSATPINGTFLDLGGVQLNTECDAGVTLDGGVVTLTNLAPGLGVCLTSLAVGDDAWGDSTLDVEVRPFGSTFAGVAFHYPEGAGAGGPRQAALITPDVGSAYSLVLTRKASGQGDLPAGSSIPLVQEGVWHALRVTTVGRDVSVAVAPLGSVPQEVLRWHDVGAQSTTTGRLGLALVGTFGRVARADLRALRARSGGDVPDGGPTSVALSFSGTQGADRVRLVPSNDARFAAIVPCPALGPGCSTCAPKAGSQCVELNMGGLVVASASVDMPLGIDVEKPWSLRFKYAADFAVGPNQPRLVSSGSGDFQGRAIISGANLDAGSLLGFETTTVGHLNPGEWTLVELNFDPKQGAWSLALDGRAAIDAGTIPAGLDPHFGALIFGGGLFHTQHGWWTDVEISQP